DDPSLIDWKLSARLSSVRGEAEFMVREDYADEAPRSIVVADRRPSMALYPPDLPWLSKPEVLRNVWRAVAATTLRELGLAGYLWDLVPVVVQDPVWEQSFPVIDRLVVPFTDPASGRTAKVRITLEEAGGRRRANEARLAGLLGDFRSLGLDPVVIGDSAPAA